MRNRGGNRSNSEVFHGRSGVCEVSRGDGVGREPDDISSFPWTLDTPSIPPPSIPSEAAGVRGNSRDARVHGKLASWPSRKSRDGVARPWKTVEIGLCALEVGWVSRWSVRRGRPAWREPWCRWETTRTGSSPSAAELLRRPHRESGYAPHPSPPARQRSWSWRSHK